MVEQRDRERKREKRERDKENMERDIVNERERKTHRDKTRVQMPAKRFPHLKLKCQLFMGPTLVFETKQRIRFFKIKFGVFNNKNKILTILFIVNYEKITL